MPSAASVVDRVAEELIACRADPVRYAETVFPWGEGELAGHGLEDWQRRILTDIGTAVERREFPVQIAVSSGHDIGKSALVAMIVKWAMATMPDCRGVVTANTESQLRTKTWVELAKWHRMSLDEPFFRVEGTSFRAMDSKRNRTWRVDAIPWSESNSEAFQGLHNKGRRVLVVMDEASGIPGSIWEATEGALTDADTELIWIAFGNPTQPDGRFFECFHKFRHRWRCYQLDSRTVSLANKAKLDAWVTDYGEDSDFVRVRVRGVFPRGGDEQFIPHDLVEAGRRRPAPALLRGEPWVCGLDWSLGGAAETVLAPRCGQDARGLPWKVFNEGDEARLVAMVSQALHDWQAAGIRFVKVFGDAGGLGQPLCQRLASLGWPVQGVNNGSGAMQNTVYHDKGAEMWGAVKAWLAAGGAIPDDETLTGQLTGRRMGRLDTMNRVSIEAKDLMARRGLESPDRADALALTFAFPVSAVIPAAVHSQSTQLVTDWDPMRELRNG